MEMSQTTIYQLPWRSKDTTQNSIASIVKNKYFEAQLQIEIFFFNENCVITERWEKHKTNLLDLMSLSLLVWVRSCHILVYQSDYWWVITLLNLIPQNYANDLSLALHGIYPSSVETSLSIILFQAKISNVSETRINLYVFEGHFCVHFTKRKTEAESI